MLNISEPQQFASWEQPIEMLYACHGKVKRFCRQLSLLPSYLEKHGINQAVQNDVKQILTYFNQAAPLHHDDEEKDFFPTLLAHIPPHLAEQTLQNIRLLEQEHLLLHQNWAKLRRLLEDLSAGEIDRIDQTEVDRFIAGYDRHIALEEPLFELGRQYIPVHLLQDIGEIMAMRRK
ncbi:hemerythrin domain-containing protein [Caviibacterium pharyngocola]|uniref:Hemerythrin-like domain-containing protein n=1 Tax=Caviibacterium pharyngocola TaxID=28159 RepID=A0A2M8RT87_9PAST|nr:hemerythrin domain-containing protein [Caviibacterium pharyngocola]PJG82100.1 hypothetical protein CVP04_10620 [Caviibacterium pharyngocola]